MNMIAEAQLAVAPILEQPVRCSRCKIVLVESLPEDKRDDAIEAGDGSTIFYLFSERVCLSCYESDRFEAAYLKANLD